jgi:exonuclease SbcD
MIIAHISDCHFDEGPRLDEAARLQDIFIEECRRAKADLIVDTGDQYHPHVSGRPATPNEELFAVDCHRRRAEIAPEVGVLGNHDVPANIDLFNRLEGRNPIWFATRPHKYTFREFDVLCLPWFWKSHIAASLPAETDGEEVSRRTNAVAQQYLITMRGEAALTRSQGRTPIALGHLMVAGSTLSSGQNQSVMGTTVALTPWDLQEVDAAVFCLGHIHRAQQWFDGRVAYAGSPMRFDFGESEPKGFRLIEIEKDGEGYRVRNDFIELPARRIDRYELDFTNETNLANLKERGLNACLEVCDSSSVRDAMVRFRYKIRPEDRQYIDDKELERRLLEAGAFSAKADPQLEHTARVRSEAIVTAESTWDKLMAFWQSKNIAIPEDVAERLKVKLTQIESGETPAVATSKRFTAAAPGDGLFPEESLEDAVEARA